MMEKSYHKCKRLAALFSLIASMLFCTADLQAQTGDVYGVYCKDNKTLYITRSTTPIMVNDYYDGHKVERVFEEKWIMDSATNNAQKYNGENYPNYPAWRGLGYNNFNRIQFDTVIKPVCIRCWFYLINEIVNIDKLDTSEVTDMSNAFLQSTLTHLDLSTFDTSNVTTMLNMFYQSKQLESVDLSSFNTDKVTTMNNMFFQCEKLQTLDLSSFSNAVVTNMANMFNGCTSLSSINFNGFGTANVTNMTSMFSGCENLATRDFSMFNTAKVTSMASMFLGCKALDMPDLSSFDTSKVTAMGGMFYNCTSLNYLDIRNFDTSKVTNMTNMFGGCTNLKNIICDGTWNSKTTSTNMFNGCSSLGGENGKTYTADDITAAYANPGNDGYFTLSQVDNTGNASDGYYWSTYYNSNVSSKADDNTTVYIAELDDVNKEMILHEVEDNVIDRGQAVILRSSQTGMQLTRSYQSLVGSTDTDYDNVVNALSGKDTTQDVPTDEGLILTLARMDGALGFYKYVGTQLKAHKAYLALNTSTSEAGYRFRFDEDGTATGIKDLQSAEDRVQNANVYDLQGRRVADKAARQLPAGIYIMNGKKVYVK